MKNFLLLISATCLLGGVEALANESAQTTINVQQPCLCLKFKPGHFSAGGFSRCRFDYSSADDFKQKFMKNDCPTWNDSWSNGGSNGGNACNYSLTFEIVIENNEFFVQPHWTEKCWRWDGDSDSN